MFVFKIKQYVFRSNIYFLKRTFFHSTIWNASNELDSTLKDQIELNDESDLCQKTKKLVKVAILGLPNAGKSTLVNKLVHRSVCVFIYVRTIYLIFLNLFIYLRTLFFIYLFKNLN